MNRPFPLFHSLVVGPSGLNSPTAALVGGQVRLALSYDDMCGDAYNLDGFTTVDALDAFLRTPGEPLKHGLRWRVPLQHMEHTAAWSEPSVLSPERARLSLNDEQRLDLLVRIGRYRDGEQTIYHGQFGPRQCVNSFGDKRLCYGSQLLEPSWEEDHSSVRYGTLAIRPYRDNLIAIARGHRAIRRPGGDTESWMSYEPWVAECEFNDRALRAVMASGARPTDKIKHSQERLATESDAPMDELFAALHFGLEERPIYDLSRTGHYRTCMITRPGPSDLSLTLEFLKMRGMQFHTVTVDTVGLLLQLRAGLRHRKGIELPDGTLLNNADARALKRALFG